jgi:putative cardiolipin synthase
MLPTIRRSILPVAGSIVLSACTGISPAPIHPKAVSITQLPKGKAPLLGYLSQTDRPLGRHSAFYSLDDPRDAFAARIFLLDSATTSLDVQYYIYEGDQTGEFFAYHLLKAADRGVKVRILIDDLITTGKDREFEMMAAHPNIELRLFNPNPLRKSLRYLALLFDVERLGKRMHNKSLIADGAAAIIGGRNIGDVYYAADSKTLFLDYDILAIGRVLPEIYRGFDTYWNSDVAIPAEEILESSFTDEEYRQERVKLGQRAEAFRSTAIGRAMIDSAFAKALERKGVKMIVADKASFLYDYPEKVKRDENDVRTHLSSRIDAYLGRVRKRVVIISPYFIPSEHMVKRLRELRARGVEVEVLTNSLASTDVFPVYSGYRWSIQTLVKSGVKLYELKAQSFERFLHSETWLKSHRTSLHTKMIIIDSDRLVVGSANIDPRSNKLNTEQVLIVTSSTLAGAKRRAFDRIDKESDFYRLSWGICPGSNEEDAMEGPLWHTHEQGREKSYCSPPQAGFFKTLGTDLLSYLPIEGYL